MNPNYTEFKFPKITAHPWSKVFSKRMPPDAVDLVCLFSVPAVHDSLVALFLLTNLLRMLHCLLPYLLHKLLHLMYMLCKATQFSCHAQVSKLLHYSPVTRVTAIGALTHPFFDELRDPNTTLPNGRPLMSHLLAKRVFCNANLSSRSSNKLPCYAKCD